jgi:hypothetical protein
MTYVAASTEKISLETELNHHTPVKFYEHTDFHNLSETCMKTITENMHAIILPGQKLSIQRGIK